MPSWTDDFTVDHTARYSFPLGDPFTLGGGVCSASSYGILMDETSSFFSISEEIVIATAGDSYFLGLADTGLSTLAAAGLGPGSLTLYVGSSSTSASIIDPVAGQWIRTSMDSSGLFTAQLQGQAPLSLAASPGDLTALHGATLYPFFAIDTGMALSRFDYADGLVITPDGFVGAALGEPVVGPRTVHADGFAGAVMGEPIVSWAFGLPVALPAPVDIAPGDPRFPG